MQITLAQGTSNAVDCESMRSPQETKQAAAARYQRNRLNAEWMAKRKEYKIKWEASHTSSVWEPRRLAGQRTYANRKHVIKARSAARYRANKGLVKQYLGSHPCVDCGYSDVRALEFDHTQGCKSFTIGKRITLQWDKLLAEISKCEVRCANCHRIRHCEARKE